ncbi:MAG: dTDP-glucose 4,6-dehydratase [Bacteroidales bacterium]|nr:dTDP-glucose 4,6-dehydratase [Bacteroidales bacterium]
MKTILVTGGAGFIGSNFIRYLKDNHPDYFIVNLDVLTYAGNLWNLRDLENHVNYKFLEGDITDEDTVRSIFKTHEIDTVVNFAAETHVDKSIECPNIFLRTNVIGTQVLLDTSLIHWKTHPNDKNDRTYRQGVRFIQISTDEVYGSLVKGVGFTETMPLLPGNPYAASKAAADLLVMAYANTYGLPVNITRCSNNYGPYQFPEKLIPLIINNCLENRDLPVYGDGMQSRDWLHVYDHCTAIDKVMQKGVSGEIYNIGGNNERTNLEIVEMIINEMGASRNLIKHVKDRPGHDRRYALDNSKITKTLGWKPSVSFQKGISETIKWYKNNQT